MTSLTSKEKAAYAAEPTVPPSQAVWVAANAWDLGGANKISINQNQPGLIKNETWPLADDLYEQSASCISTIAIDDVSDYGLPNLTHNKENPVHHFSKIGTRKVVGHLTRITVIFSNFHLWKGDDTDHFCLKNLAPSS